MFPWAVNDNRSVETAEFTDLARGRAGDRRGTLCTSKPAHSSLDGGILSPREIQGIELGSRGLQNVDIARTLFLAQSTVKWYWQRIFEKLEVRPRPDAIRAARENHWIQ